MERRDDVFTWVVLLGQGLFGAWLEPAMERVGGDRLDRNPISTFDMARAMEPRLFRLSHHRGLAHFVADVYQGSTEYYLKTALTVPKADPMPLGWPLIGQATNRLGIVATMNDGILPTVPGARLGATLDHLTHGRVGLNLVTAHKRPGLPEFTASKSNTPTICANQIADEWMEVADRTMDIMGTGGDRRRSRKPAPSTDFTKVASHRF